MKKGFTLIEALIVVGIIAATAAIVMPIFMRARGGNYKSSCHNNLKVPGLGLAQYTQDYDEHLPLLLVTPTSNMKDNFKGNVSKAAFYGWADAIWPYLKSNLWLHCPTFKHPQSVPSTFNPLARDCTDYWLNSRVAALKIDKILQPAVIISLGEGNDGGDMTDARYNLPALPNAWIQNQNSPAYRHKGMATYGFLDGHVKALPPTAITNEPIANGKPTFEWK